jgi:glycosyltransferase involved in cell wall biosynthesis
MSGLALFVSYTAGAGGSERLLADFACALEPPVAVACPPGPLADRLRDFGIEHIPVAARPMEMRRSIRDRVATPARIFGLGRELRAVGRARAPAVVVAWNSRGLLATRAGRLDTRLVFQQNELVRGRLTAAAVRRSARRVDMTVALSHTIAADLGVDAQVVPGGVDPADYRHGWPRPGPPTALWLGALVPWKRPDLALDAVAQAARELPELRLTMAGSTIGEDRGLLARLRERAGRDDLAGRVDFVGHIADPRDLLASSHCLLHCADREPYGMAIVEALASGLPVVAPAAGGPAELIDAMCGRLYAPGDAATAAGALVEILRDPEPLGRAARSKAERDLSLSTAQARYRELLAPLRSP